MSNIPTWLMGSNTGCATDYFDWGLPWFFSVPTGNRDTTLIYNMAASFHIYTNSLTIYELNVWKCGSLNLPQP
jgi:hypothetical protein